LALFNYIPGMEGHKVAGMGSSLDIKIAARRALTEAEQSACFWNDKFDSGNMNEEIIYHPSLNLEDGLVKVLSKTIRVDNSFAFNFLNAEDELNEILIRIGPVAERIIAVDITDKTVGLPAVKVLIPSFEDCCEEKFLRNRCREIKKIITSYKGKK